MASVFEGDDEFDDGFENSLTPTTKEIKSDLPPNLLYEVQEYLKVGTYCGWSWEDYKKTPTWVIEEISKEIDKRLLPYIESMAAKSVTSGKKGKSQLPFSHFHLAILLALATMSGGDD